MLDLQPEPEPEPQPDRPSREWNQDAARMPYRQWNGHGISVYWLPDTAAYLPAVSSRGDQNQSQRRRDHEAFVQFMQQRPDPHPVVAPVSGIIRVTFAEEYMRVHLIQSSRVACEINMRQLRDMNTLRDRVSGASERRLIESIRRRYTYIGNKSLRALGGSRLWKQLWCFAGQCLTALRRRYRPRRMTWERLRARRDQRRKYVRLYHDEQMAAYATAAAIPEDGSAASALDPHTIVEQAFLGRLHPALFRHVREAQRTRTEASKFGFSKYFWREDTDTKRSDSIREIEADMSVADVQLYRKITVMKILEESITASERQSGDNPEVVQHQFPLSWWAQYNPAKTYHDDLSYLHRDILRTVHEYEPDLFLQRHVRTHLTGKFSCGVTLAGFNVAGEQLSIDFGSVDAEVKFFGSLVDCSRISATELTMSLLREDVYTRSQSQDGTFMQPAEACIPILRSIDKLQKGHHRVLFTTASDAVGACQGLNTWDRGIFQRDFHLILNSIDVSFDCKAYDSLHQLFNDLCSISRGQWVEWDEPPERWRGRVGRLTRGRDMSRSFGQRFARFRHGSAARSATNIAAYDESSDSTSSDAPGIARSPSLRHVRSVDWLADSLNEPEFCASEAQSPNARLLHEVWKCAVARGLTDRDAVRIMLDHLHSEECTPQYYLYMWLQRLRVTRAQLNRWIRELPQFDSQLLEELHSLCSPELITGNDEETNHPGVSTTTSVPLTTQHDTVKREGRKVLRCHFNFPKICISAHINDPQSPTLLIVAEKLECGRSPAEFFSPGFIDRGAEASYYETMNARFSRTRAFVAPRDYLYHCMRNRKLNELSILSESADVDVTLRTLAVPKPIFVGLPREKYSLRFSALAFVFSYDRLIKFASIVRTFMSDSEMLRPRPRHPNDLPGAIIYDYECRFVSVVFAQSKEVSLRMEAEMCSVSMMQPRWVNIEPATAAKSTDLKMRKLIVMIGDPTGIQDGSPIAVAELGGLVYRMGVSLERKLVIDSLTLSGCRPRSISILSFTQAACDSESTPVILYQQGYEGGELVRALTVTPVQIAYHPDVFALLVDFVSSSVGIPEFLKTGPQRTREVALANASPLEPTRISLDQDQPVKSRLVLHGVCAMVVLAHPPSTVSLHVEKTVANIDEGHASICIDSVAMCTGPASEFFRAECHTGNAVELSLGTRDGTRVIELSVQQPWCRIGNTELLAIQRASAALRRTVARLRARGVESELPQRGPLLGVASPSLLASPLPKHQDAPRLSHRTHCQIKMTRLQLELYVNGSNSRSLVIQFSASCKHDEFGGELYGNEEMKGKVTLKGLRVYFAPATSNEAHFRQHLCFLQCSLIRPEYTIRQQENSRLDIVLDREQRSPAVVCQFCTADVAELAALCKSLHSALSSSSSDNGGSIFRVPALPRSIQRKMELGMDLLFEDLRVYYVSGSTDTPLIRMLLKSMNNRPFVYRSGAKSEEPRLEAGVEFCVDVLNANISCWEPLLEPVAVQFQHRQVRVGHSKLHIGAGMVNINITRAFVNMAHEVQQQIETLHGWRDCAEDAAGSVQSASTTSYSDEFSLEPSLPCIVRNETHTDLYFPRHTFRRSNDRVVATPRKGSRTETGHEPSGAPGSFVGRLDESHQLDLEDDDDDDEGEEQIEGTVAYPERELRSGIVTSDSSRHRPHRIQFRMDGCMPTVVDIEKTGVFPVTLYPKPAASSLKSARDDGDDTKRSISLICKVSVITSGDSKGGKRVVIRSPVVIRNSSARALDIKFGDHKVPGNFEPSGQELPLEVLHTAGHFGDGQLMLRPSRAGRVGNLYTWSRRLCGKTLSHMRQGLGQSFQLSCIAIDGSSPDFVISVYVVNTDGQTYIEFLPPLVIENALACDCQVYMRDQTGGNVFATDVMSGGKTKVHEIDLPSGQNTMVIATAGFTGELRQHGNSWPDTIRLRNREGQSLVLAAEVTNGHGDTEMAGVKSGALFVALYTTHWVLNHASVNIDLVQQGLSNNALSAVAHSSTGIDAQIAEKAGTLFSMESADMGKNARRSASATFLNPPKLGMFSFLPRSFVGDSDEKYDRASIANRLILRCTESGAAAWSDPTVIDIEKKLVLNLPGRSSDGKHYQFCTTIRSVPGAFHRTKLVSFTPCVLLTNRTEGVLLIKDATVMAESSSVVVLPNQASEFHYKHANENKTHINVRSVDYEWSRALKIDHADDLYVFLRHQDGDRGETIRVTVKTEGATTFVAFQMLDQSYAQLRVENECKPSTIVKFRQSGISEFPLEVVSRGTFRYSWEDPQLAHRLQIMVHGTDVSWEVDIDDAKLRTQQRCGEYVLHVIDAGGSTCALRVMDLSTSMLVDPGTPVASGSARANRGLDLHSSTVTWNLDLTGIGLSFIDNGGLTWNGNRSRLPPNTTEDAQELVHCCIYSIRLNAIVAAETELEFYAEYMQIDNQWDRRLSLQRAVDTETNRRSDGKYSVVIAPTDKDMVRPGDRLPTQQPRGRSKSFLHILIERVRSPGVDCYRNVLVHLTDLTIKLDGNLIERVVGPAELTANRRIKLYDKPRTVWLFRGHAGEAHHLHEIVLEERLRLEQCTAATVAPRRLFIQRMQILPYTVTVSHSGRPSVLATDGFANVPIRFTKYEGRHIHAATFSLFSKLRALYGRQLALKLPQFIGAASLFGNPAGVVQTFRQELENVVEESVASLRDFNLLELKNTMVTALRRLFAKATGGLGYTCHWAAETLNQQTLTANSVTVSNLPPDVQSEELTEIFSTHDAIVVGVIQFQPCGDTLEALARFNAADGMTRALSLDGVCLRNNTLTVKQQPRADPPSDPFTGLVRGVVHCCLHLYSGICSMQISKCIMAPIQGSVALLFQPVSGLFGYYDRLFGVLGRLYPREPYRAYRQRIRSPRRFGRHGSLLPLTSGSSLDRDLLQFVEALDELDLDGPATVVHQTRRFALLTTKHALVYVRRQPTLRLEWYIFASCLLAYDVSTAFMQTQAATDPNRVLRSTVATQPSVNLLCMCPLQLISQQTNSLAANSRVDKHLRSRSVQIETQAQVGPLLRRLRTWWICANTLPVDNDGSHLATCISPGVVARVPAFRPPVVTGTAPMQTQPHRNRGAVRTDFERVSLTPRFIRFHDVSGASNHMGAARTIGY